MKFLCLLLISPIYLFGQSISTGTDGKSWNLKTKSSSYQIKVSDKGSVDMLYFGDKSQDVSQIARPLGNEVTVRGGYSTSRPVLEAVFSDRVRDIELVFEKATVTEIDGYSTLVIQQKDKFYPLRVVEYLRVLPEYDLIEKWLEIENTDKKNVIQIENARSGTIFLPKNSYDLTHLSGRWSAEFQPNVTRLTQGLKSYEVKDFKSYGSSFFAVRPAGESEEISGEVWFGTLQYSGNWVVDLEKYPTGEVQVTSGINFWDQLVNLKAGKKFSTPKFIVGYTQGGMEGVSLSLAGYTREKVSYATHREKIRPVLYNSWYATEFKVNETHQLALAKVAKELGVEVFVIDDGWFEGRVSDRSGLGDWYVDKKKFPNGLKPMIDKITAMGMDFGIWIEPEMVNANSNLYRKHPDWVFHYPNRTRHEGRNQLILNLAREDVYNYLYQSFSKLLRENNIKFIKWDMNKTLTDPGFPSAPTDEQRAVRIKYVENLYRLLDTLRSEFPDVWFENCSSGGGRIDLGMMARTDFSWVSDNTDAVDRIFIQYSYLNVFPANTMIGWVTQEYWHKQDYPLAFKFDVSMAGVLGVGYDITKWNEKERQVGKEKIALYKEIRKTVQFGDLYRLVSPYENNRSVLEYLSKDKKEAVIFVYNLAEYPNDTIDHTRKSRAVKLRGLQVDANYKFEGLNGVYKGSQLMDVGFEFPLHGTFQSQIFKLVKQ